MAQKNDCRCFKLRGKLYTREYYCPEDADDKNPNPWVYVGNSENFSITPNTTTETVPDYTTCAGGTLCKNTTLDSVDVSFTTTCHSKKNLSLAFLGQDALQLATAIVDECHVLPTPLEDPCVIIPNECVDPDVPITVSVGGTALVEGTDFFVENGVITIEKSGAFAAGDEVLLGYSTKESFCIEGLLEASKDVELKFVGKNCDDNQPVIANIYRACLTASDEFTFLSDTFNRITFTGTLLQDPSKKGDGVSKYFKVVGVE